MELRIGNTDESANGLVQLTGNPLIDTHQGPNGLMTVEYSWGGVASGRYLTLQQKYGGNFFGIAELFVFNVQ